MLRPAMNDRPRGGLKIHWLEPPILTDSGGYQVFSLAEEEIRGDRHFDSISKAAHTC